MAGAKLIAQPHATAMPSGCARGTDARSGKLAPMNELARVRKIALGLPEVNERVSHGEPCFFVRDKRPTVLLP
jgi:hypothetical protein